MLKDGYLWVHALYAAASLINVSYSHYIAPSLIVLAMFVSDDTIKVLYPFYKSGSHFVYLLGFVLAIIFAFSVIGFLYLRTEFYNPNSVYWQEHFTCDTLSSCFYTLVLYASRLKSGDYNYTTQTRPDNHPEC